MGLWEKKNVCHAGSQRKLYTMYGFAVRLVQLVILMHFFVCVDVWNDFYLFYKEFSLLQCNYFKEINPVVIVYSESHVYVTNIYNRIVSFFLQMIFDCN